MTWLTQLRVSWGLRLLPLMFLAFVYGRLMDPGATGFTLLATRLYAWMLAACVPSCAACLEVLRLRTGGVLDGGHERSMVRILTVPLALVVLPTAVMMGLHLAGTAPGWMLVIATSWLLAWAVIGGLLGMVLPGVLAMAVALLLPFLLVLYGPAIEPLWWRYLFGYYGSCCSVGDVLDPRASRAGLRMSVGLLASGVLGLVAVVTLRRWLPRFARSGTVLSLLLASVMAMWMASQCVRGMDALPGVPRTDPQTCAGNAPAICAWPEYVPQRDAHDPYIRGALVAWRAAGLDVPDKVVQARNSETGGRMQWVLYYEEATPEEVILTLAETRTSAVCPKPGREHRQRQDRVMLWMLLTAGVSPPPELGKDLAAGHWVKRLQSRPMSEQGQVIRAELARLDHC